MKVQAQKLTDILKKQLTVNKSLLAVAEQKTEVIKKHDMSELNEILKSEQKHIALLKQLEQQRRAETAHLLSGLLTGVQTELVLSDVINLIDEPEQGRLQKLQQELVTCIQHLKERNDLNQQLLYQSMQFVNLTLDLIQPRPQTFNYERPQTQTNGAKTRSVFNSKA
jgi:flagellar biosynthesis/type III secretory pathway chaperone